MRLCCELYLKKLRELPYLTLDRQISFDFTINYTIPFKLRAGQQEKWIYKHEIFHAKINACILFLQILMYVQQHCTTICLSLCTSLFFMYKYFLMIRKYLLMHKMKYCVTIPCIIQILLSLLFYTKLPWHFLISKVKIQSTFLYFKIQFYLM